MTSLIALVAFALPTYVIRFPLFGIPITCLELLILVLFFVWCVRMVFLGDYAQWAMRFRQNPSQRFVVASGLILICIGALSVLATPDMRAGLGIYKAYILEPALFALVSMACLKTERDVRRVLWALVLSGGVIAVIAVMQYITGIGIPEPWNAFPDRRATAVYGFPNAVGLYLAPITTLCIGLLVFWKGCARREQFGLAFITLLCVSAIFCARADGAVVAVVAATGCMLLFTRFRWYAAAAALILAVVAFAFEPTRDILLFHDTSGEVRRALWTGTWHLLRAQPIFGAGIGAFPIVYDIYRLPSHVELLQYPHNVFLDFWVELGIAGLAWITAMLVWVCVRITRLVKSVPEHALPLLGVCVAFTIYGLVDVPYFKNDLSVLFWLSVALLAVLPIKTIKKDARISSTTN